MKEKPSSIEEANRADLVLAKFITPTEGKRIVLACINDNWRRYKTTIKQNHFLPYKCVNEMLKNRPKSILESHFRKLIAYWRTEKVKAASKENNEPPTQAEMFVETRQSTKGKSLDEDTLDVIQHAVEKASLEGKVDVMQKEVDELKSLVKMMLQQKSSGVDLEMLAAQLGSTLGNPNNDAHEEENYVEGKIELD
ncbi:hypothetical protein Ahy_B05g079246 [Arachis hypogaea]|uniref:Uncharacterized protein n=1 Tax=Arachis hypogaea TaxID=3818 RepID=A0A444Z9C1_ARAHY|nr:hypothetical protein Ahy_B05g079246 [Arachis hypogaea]